MKRYEQIAEENKILEEKQYMSIVNGDNQKIISCGKEGVSITVLQEYEETVGKMRIFLDHSEMKDIINWYNKLCEEV